MPVAIFSVKDQDNFFRQSNQKPKIPMLMRNKETGWPLIHLSCDENRFELGIVNLMALLEAHSSIAFDGENKDSYFFFKPDFNLDTERGNYLNFRFTHWSSLIAITNKNNTLDIRIPYMDTSKLKQAFMQPTPYAIADLGKPNLEPDWLNYTIQNGKEIYTDFGVFLDSQVPEATDLFEKIFMVPEFREALEQGENALLQKKSLVSRNSPEQKQFYPHSKTIFGEVFNSLQANEKYPNKQPFLTTLESLSEELQKNEQACTNQAIILCVKQLLVKLNDPKKPLTHKEIENAFHRLDKKLTSPVKPYLTGLLCGAILGLVGLVSGGILGAVATSWGGGFGAFAAAAAGATLGVKAGMVLGGGLGALAGIGIGFFGHRKQLIAKTHEGQCDALIQTQQAMHGLIKSS
ncbi:MAG: hypothetical protein WC785_07655 [Tatlockia sp.]|jgi:hypothetical protein